MVFGLYGQSLQSISPDNALQGQELTVTITGENTHFGQGTQTTVTAVWLSKDGSTIDGTLPTAENDPSNTSFNSDFAIPSDAAIVGKRLREIELPPDCFISLVVKKGGAELPSDALVLEPEDELVAVTRTGQEQVVYDILTGVP